MRRRRTRRKRMRRKRSSHAIKSPRLSAYHYDRLRASDIPIRNVSYSPVIQYLRFCRIRIEEVLRDADLLLFWCGRADRVPQIRATVVRAIYRISKLSPAVARFCFSFSFKWKKSHLVYAQKPEREYRAKHHNLDGLPR